MTALIAQFQRELVLARRRGQMLDCARAAMVDLDIAEKFVVLLLAGRQIEHVEGDARVSAFRLDPIAVQIIVIGDREIELDRAAIDCLGLDPERLFDRQQVIRVGGVSGASASGDEQREKRQK